MFHIAIAMTLLFVSTPVWAQPADNVRIDHLDSLRNTYRISYVAPSNSVYASNVFDDTLFCAAMINTLRGARNQVLPMQRISDNAYVTQLVLPDSATSVRVEICIPTDRAPDGILSLYVSPDGGQMWPGTALNAMSNADSALRFERRLYPHHYYAYYQYWQRWKSSDIDELISPAYIKEWRKLDSLISVVTNSPATTFNRYFTLSLLYGSRVGGDTLEYVYLDSAVHAQLRDRTHEPLLEDDGLWNFYYYPSMQKGALVIAEQRFVLMQRLAEAYPQSVFAKFWIERLRDITPLDTAIVRTVINVWSTSYDVDVLSSLGWKMLDTSSPLYNPIEAETLITRAELSNVQRLGFRNGENIFGSMGRLDGIHAQMIVAFTKQGRYKKATERGEQYMRLASNTHGRQSISEQLAKAHLAAGDTAAAAKLRTYTLPEVASFVYETISGKRDSISGLRGKIVVLNFWFVGCAGCALEHKSLNDFGLKYRGDERIVFLSIALNDKRTLEKYLSRSPLAADVIANAGEICEKIGVIGFPTHVILDRAGKTILWEVGGSEEAGEHLAKVVSKLLR